MTNSAEKSATTERKKAKATGLAKASGVVAVMTLASRLLGMVRDMTIAFFFGAGFATDAFFVAFKIPNLLRRLVAEGSLATAFVPLFSEEIAKSHEDAVDALRRVATFTFVLTVALTVLGILFADPITALFAPGFITQAAKFELASTLLVIMFPYVILVSTLALASGVLNTLGEFAWPAAAPALLNICLILAILLFGNSFEPGILVLAYGVLFGGLIALIPQIIVLRKYGFSIRFSNPAGSPVVKRLCRLMLPSVISASVYQLMVFINTVLASLLREGSVSWLYYADRLFQFPLGVFSIAVGTALLPALSRAAANGEEKNFTENLERAFSWVSYITIPASAGLIVLATPLAQTIYFRGSFSQADLVHTATALCGFAVGLWSISCHAILVRCYLAKKNTLIPAIVACVSIAINLIMAICFMGSPLASDTSSAAQIITLCQSYLPVFEFGHIGLALSGSLASFFNFYVLLLLLPRISVALPLRRTLYDILLSILCSLCMIFVIGRCPIFSEFHIMFTLLFHVLIGMLTYLTTSILLRVSPALQFYSFFRQQILRFLRLPT